MNIVDVQSFAQKITNALKLGLPRDWDGKSTILDMKNNGCRNWKQMEWPGFYFQWKSECLLPNNIRNFMVPGPKYGNVGFDGFYEIPWDFKVHTKESGLSVPTNGLEEIKMAVQQYDQVGFIIAIGSARMDQPPFLFKQWVDKLKGKKSQYEVDREKRGAPSRKRKTYFSLEKLVFIVIDANYLKNCASFQKGMRNSNGKPRKEKLMLELQSNNYLKVEIPY